MQTETVESFTASFNQTSTEHVHTDFQRLTTWPNLGRFSQGLQKACR